jgi:FkbM family methyltransferase
MEPISVPFDGSQFFINATSPTCRKRAVTFDTKEPDTVAWIKALRPDDVVWDIGANIGIYTIPMAFKAKQVVAFEPHPSNYLEIVSNVLLNGVRNVVPLPIALGDVTGIANLAMSGNHPGVAMNTIGDSYHGHEAPKNLPSIPVIAMRGYKAMDYLDLAMPTAIKLDVDGIEFALLKYLPLYDCRTIIIEVDTHHRDYRALMEHMNDGRFTFDPEQAISARRKSGPNEGVGNIIFSRETPHGL